MMRVKFSIHENDRHPHSLAVPSVPIPEAQQHTSDFGCTRSFDATPVEVEIGASITGHGEAKAAVGADCQINWLEEPATFDDNRFRAEMRARPISQSAAARASSPVLPPPTWTSCGPPTSSSRACRLPAASPK